MTSSAIVINSEAYRGGEPYAPLPDVMASQPKEITLGNILSDYAEIGLKSFQRLSEVDLKIMELKETKSCTLYVREGRRYLSCSKAG